MKFIYKDNNNGGKVVCVIEADNILDADKEFEKQTKINPVKKPSIGCLIEFKILTAHE